MTSRIRNRIFFVILLMIISGSALYYFYALNQIPKKVAQSTENFINVDSLRFTFKVGSLTQKGFNLYLQAQQTLDEDVYYEALDNFEAATAFLDISYTRNIAFENQVKPLLQEVIELINTHEFEPTDEALQRLSDLVSDIYFLSSNQERQVWEGIQSKYIESQTSEYRLTILYEVLAITLFGLLMLGGVHFWRQTNFFKKIEESELALERLAYFDVLTEMPNRKQIEELLEIQIHKAERQALDCFVALIDVDDFKRVNDLLGHSAGDALLKEVSHRIRESIRLEDTLGRLGGDEFLLIFGDSIDQTEILQILERIHAAFEKPVVLEGNDFFVTISTGIAHLDDVQDKTHSVAELIKFADIAMYQAKKEGKNRFYIYDKLLGQKIEKDHQLDVEIKQALDNDEFELYYQPQVCAQTYQVIGAEALIRWNHPEKGFLPPSEFIDVIEKGLHTQAFGEWVIRQAVMQQQRWQKAGLDLNIAINLSVKHILSSDFLQSISLLVAELQADLERIHFEITEYELMTHDSNGIDDLEKLVEAGFTLYLDDFGTGYSSISYLEKLPVHAIKIDKSFVDYIDEASQKKGLVDGILTLAKALDLKVVAEGVETRHQAESLRANDCDYLQGYWIAKPMPVATFESFLQTYKGP